jgi:pyrroline-5-carboxylate reductase
VDGRLAIIGAGRMGEAILGGLLRTGMCTPEQVVCTDVRAAQCEAIAARYGVEAHGDNRAAVADAEVVLLALKPQVLGGVVADLADALDGEPTVVSIAAGVTTASLEALLPPGTPVVRVMPNTPALVEEGMSLIAGGAHATARSLELARELLGAVGEVLELPESQIDAATAISGSGPAYVFLLAEAMIEAGVHLGLARDVATTMVGQTLRGSATLVRDSGDHPAVLREAVTSPGGTTAAALARFEAAGLRATVIEAATAARDRARELGGG